jgi:hypothetical protein
MSIVPWTTDWLELHLHVVDPDVKGMLANLGEDDRKAQALAALRIGALAIQRARSSFDVDAIRNESERLLTDLKNTLEVHASDVTQKVGASLSAWFVADTGALTQRVQQLVSDDGELASILARHVDGDNSSLARTLARHLAETSPVFRLLDPKHKNGVITSLEAVIEEALADQDRRITQQFDLNDSESALSRLVREITDQQGRLRKGFADDVELLRQQLSLNHEDSALSRLVQQVDQAQQGIVEQFSLDSEDSALSRIKKELSSSIDDLGQQQREFQCQVLDMLARLEERKRMAAAGTQHGHDFEDAVGLVVRRLAEGVGDVFDATGTRVGKIRNCKKGDFVVQIGPERKGMGRRFVIEAKEDASYTDPKALAEMEVARKNRDAEVGIFFYSKLVAPEVRAFRRAGSDILVVWDSEDRTTDVLLEAAYAVISALLAGADALAAELDVDVDAMEKSIHNIENQVERMEGIRKKWESIRCAAGTIDETTRIITENLGREARRLLGHAKGLRTYVTD